MMTFATLVQQYGEKYALPRLSRPEAFASRVAPALERFGRVDIHDITLADIEDWRVVLGRERDIRGERRRPTPACVNRQVAELRRILGWAAKRGLIAATPCAGGLQLETEDNVRDRRISPDEEDRLLAAATPRMRALLILALDTGLRAGELRQLTSASVRWDQQLILLAGKQTKSKRGRQVPWATTRAEAVLRWLFAQHKPQELLKGVRLVWPQYWDRDWQQLKIEVDSRDLHWHDLRHEYASRLVEAGVSLTEIQKLLGHRSVTTTERYVYHTMARLSSSVRVLERGKAFEPA